MTNPLSKNKSVFWGLITQYVYQIVLMLLQIFIAPLLLRKSGSSALGGYASIAQFTGYLTLLDLGFFSTLSRYLSQAYNKDDDKFSFRNLFAIGRWYLLFVSLLMFSLIVIFSFVIPFSLKLSVQMQKDGQMAMILLGIWYGCRFYFMMYGISLYASQNMQLYNICSTVGVVLRFLCTLLFIHYGFGITGIVAANIAGDFITTLLQMWIFRYKNPRLELSWKVLDRSKFKELASFGLNTFLINISARIITSTTVFISGILLGASIASHYYSMYTPISLINTMILVIMYNLLPGINAMFSKGDMVALKTTYIKTFKFKLTLLFAAGCGIILYHRFIIDLWVGDQQYDGYIFTILLTFYLIIYTMANFNENIIIVTGNVNWYSRLQIVSTVLGLVVTIAAGHYYQLKGIVAGNLLAITPPAIYSFYKLVKILKIKSSIFAFLPNLGYTIILVTITTVLLFVQYNLLVKVNVVQVLSAFILFMILILFTGIEKDQRLSFLRILKK